MNKKLLVVMISNQMIASAFAQNRAPADQTQFKALAIKECNEQITNVIHSFQSLEKSMALAQVNKKLDSKTLLPWLADRGWPDFSTGLDKPDFSPVTSISQTSAALIEANVSDPNLATPYTRFEDFQHRPDSDNSWPDESKFYNEFRVGYVIDEICIGRKSRATGIRPILFGLTHDGFYYDKYKYDVVAQASLFEDYFKQASAKIMESGELALFKTELEHVKASVYMLKKFATESRTKKIL